MTEDNELSAQVKDILVREGINVLNYLDRGSTATVFKAEMRQTDKNGPKTAIVAVKFIDLDHQAVKVKEKYIPRELSIVATVSHKHIIKTHRVVKHEKRFVFIITDFAEGGDLIRVLEKGEHLAENKVKHWFSQIVSAVEYLHSKGIAHRDLKADNVLIHNNDIKLTDFGYARQSLEPDGTVKKCRSLCGTLEYQSPEAMAQCQPYDPFVSDCFSLGVLLFTIIALVFPFGSGEELRTREGRQKLCEDINRENWSLPDHHRDNEKLFSLLKQLLNPNPYSRVRSAQILSHPWFRK